jgi:hypothetical protein
MKTTTTPTVAPIRKDSPGPNAMALCIEICKNERRKNQNKAVQHSSVCNGRTLVYLSVPLAIFSVSVDLLQAASVLSKISSHGVLKGFKSFLAL